MGASLGGKNPAILAKLTLLSSTWIRSHEWVLYFDSDSYVGAPLSVDFASAVRHRNFTYVAFRENGKAIGKGSLYHNEFNRLHKLREKDRADFIREIPDRIDRVGTACLMLFHTPELQSWKQVYRPRIEHLLKYKAAFRGTEQGIWNVLFPDLVCAMGRSIHHDTWKRCFRAPIRNCSRSDVDLRSACSGQMPPP